MLQAFAAAAASALLLYLADGLRPVWLLWWIAPVPVLWAAARPKTRGVFALAFLAWGLGSLGWFGYYERLGIPVPVRIAGLAVPACWFALSALLFRKAVTRGGFLLAPFLFAASWTCYEFALLRFSPHSSFGSLAYTQADCLPVLQLASVTGVLGISFLLTLIPAAIVAATRRPAALALPLALVAGAVVYGGARLARPLPPKTLHAGLSATDGTVRFFDTTDAGASATVATAYADRVKRLAARGARVVVLPEKFTGVPDEARSRVYGLLAASARESGATAVAGLNMTGRKPLRNRATVYPASGGPVLEYDKRHFVPVFEADYAPGAGPLLYHADGFNYGVAICKDLDFPDYIRQYANGRPDVLLVPAWDFVADGWLHSRMAVMRGVELGAAVLRSAQQGLLTASDSRGRIVAEAASSDAPEVLLDVTLQASYEQTLYTALGDIVGLLSIAILSVALLWFAFDRRRAAGLKT